MKFRNVFRLHSLRGFSLLEALVTLAIMGIAGMALISLNVTSMKSAKSSQLRLDLQDIRKTISSRLSCSNTMAPFGSGTPVSCSGPVSLLDANSLSLVPPSGKLGAWNITARCEVLDGKNGLSVYATKKTASGAFAKDPLNPSIIFDESSPVSRLFSANVRPCASSFESVAAVGCPAGSTLTGFDLNQIPICVAVPVNLNCPLGQYLIGVSNGNAVCTPLPEVVKSFKTITTSVGAINAACVIGDPSKPRNYGRIDYEKTCASRFCRVNFGMQLGVVNEIVPCNYNERPFNSDPNCILQVSCSP